MTAGLDLDALLVERRGNRRFPPEVAKARHHEQARRAAAAHSMASAALRQLHSDDFAALYKQAQAKVEAKRGPLPGDPS